MGLMPLMGHASEWALLVRQDEAMGQSRQELLKAAVGCLTSCCTLLCWSQPQQQPLPAGHCCQAYCLHCSLSHTETITLLAHLQMFLLPCRKCTCMWLAQRDSPVMCTLCVTDEQRVEPFIPRLDMYWKQLKRVNS